MKKLFVLILVLSLTLGVIGCSNYGLKDPNEDGAGFGTVIVQKSEVTTDIENITRDDLDLENAKIEISGVEGALDEEITGVSSGSQVLRITAATTNGKDYYGQEEIVVKAGETTSVKEFVINKEYETTDPVQKVENGWKFTFDPIVYGVKVNQEVHLVGDMNGWDTGNKDYSLSKQDNGKWTGTFDLSDVDPSSGDIDDKIEFKFIYDTDASDNWSNQVANDGSNFIIEGPDTTAPTLDNAVISNDVTGKVVLTFNEEVTATDASGFTVTVSGSEATVNNLVVDANTITLTLDSKVTNEDTVTLDYGANDGNVKDTAGNALENITDNEVTNNVGVITDLISVDGEKEANWDNATVYSDDTSDAWVTDGGNNSADPAGLDIENVYITNDDRNLYVLVEYADHSWQADAALFIDKTDDSSGIQNIGDDTSWSWGDLNVVYSDDTTFEGIIKTYDGGYGAFTWLSSEEKNDDIGAHARSDNHEVMEISYSLDAIGLESGDTIRFVVIASNVYYETINIGDSAFDSKLDDPTADQDLTYKTYTIQ